MMRCSVFTPTHRPDRLAAAWESLQAQTFPHWEWVILPSFPVPDWEDARVRILPQTSSTKIGDLKATCCAAAQGDLFVELDHDDQLSPDCLEALVKAAQGRKRAFLYSDRIPVGADGVSAVQYTPADGWVSYPYRGRFAAKCFPLTPATLCNIRWAPDHVRAVTRAAYEAVGGHDRTLTCVDDLDLMVRLYLAGVDFIHVPRVLYTYTYHAGNAYKANQEEIRGRNQFIGANSRLRVAREWSRRHGYTVLEGPEEALSGPVGLFVADAPLRDPAALVVAAAEGAIVDLPKRLDPRPEAFRFLQRVADRYHYSIWKGSLPFPGVNPETVDAGDHRTRSAANDGGVPRPR